MGRVMSREADTMPWERCVTQTPPCLGLILWIALALAVLHLNHKMALKHINKVRFHLGFTMGIPRAQFSKTIPLPVNTVTIVGEGMTPYIFGYGVIPKNIKLLVCYAAHHCVSGSMMVSLWVTALDHPQFMVDGRWKVC